MPNPAFAAELQLYGPTAPPRPKPSLRRARKYCRRLAKRTYENFTVVSRMAPRALRQHMANIYAYCRWADDLADETGDPKQSLLLLNWWEMHLRGCYQGQTHHPVFVALADTIARFGIPDDPFIDLLSAFRQDQRQTRYETIDQLLNYCRYSANPVGRLMLYLGNCHTPERVRLSDAICTGLQLANFWQDVAQDWDRGRIYLPMMDCHRFGYDESMFAARDNGPAFRRLLAAHVEQAEGWLRRGAPLLGLLPHEMRLPVALCVYGGLAVVEAIRRQDYDVWTQRPTVSKMEKLKILARCWWQLHRGTLTGNEP